MKKRLNKIVMLNASLGGWRIVAPAFLARFRAQGRSSPLCPGEARLDSLLSGPPARNRHGTPAG